LGLAGKIEAKQWLFANGVTLNQEDGSLVVPLVMEEVARNLVVAIQEAKEGAFKHHRENVELTRALQNPEHSGRARGIGVVPWKFAWAGDSTYKTHRKSKAEQEDKLRALKDDMTRKVQQPKSEMDARVQQAVAVALSQRQGTGTQPDVVINLASQCCSSCASTAAPGDEPQENE
jgi:hypothetical protein